MKKFLYIMPAVLICMLYMLLATLAGGISGFQLIAVAYISLPLAAGILLRKGKWWGCLFGMMMGGILLYNGAAAEPRLMSGMVAGLVLMAYYAVMGLVCSVSRRKNNQ